MLLQAWQLRGQRAQGTAAAAVASISSDADAAAAGYIAKYVDFKRTI